MPWAPRSASGSSGGSGGISVRRPENHVTRAVAESLAQGQQPPSLPEVPKALLNALQALYTQRCLEPGEDQEHHLFYAGKVALVEMLARAFADQQQVGVDPEDIDFNMAERIT
jgi:hypothetical protein